MIIKLTIEFCCLYKLGIGHVDVDNNNMMRDCFPRRRNGFK